MNGIYRMKSYALFTKPQFRILQIPFILSKNILSKK